MAHQSLYRRYRPRRFGEVRGQEHVVTALRNAVANSTVGHAYLFSGPRGTGKTSTARILAKALNCENLRDGEPCSECGPCQDMEAGRSFDIFELDAASNNKVEHVRDLVERAAVGSPGRTKVYILDEVHMLTDSASNALLKTLEEPPDHVRFVLATTDPQKVLPTIRSRTQHYDFNLLSADELEAYVRWIVEDAALDVDDESVAWAVRQGRGSARDTLSALDQVVAAGGVVTRAEPIEELFEAVIGHDTGAAVGAVADALAQGHDPRVLAKAFLDALRDAFLLSLDVEVPHLVDADRERLGKWADAAGTPLLTRSMEAVGAAMVDMRTAADPRVPLEVALVRLAGSGGQSLDALVERIERLEAALASGAPAAPRAAAAPVEERAVTPAAAPEPAPSDDDVGEPASSGGGPAQARAALAKLRKGERAAESPARPAPAPADTAPPAPEPPPEVPAPATSRGPRRAAPPPEPPPAVPSPPAAAATAAPASVPEPPPDTSAATETPEPPPAEPPSTEPSTTERAAAPPAPASDQVSVDRVRSVLEDSVVPQLKGVTKALYSTGEVVGVEAGTVTFSLAVGVPPDRAERARPDVERLLSDGLASPVTLRLVEHDAAEALDLRSGGDRTTGGAGGEEPDDGDPDEGVAIDVHSLEDADDVAESGIERLTRAFPGATVVDDDEVRR